ALEEALAWDPFNVTEDADLGLRLMRYGFTVDVLDSATREEAPQKVRVWLAQRRRWLKGWMITWLVHSRRPRMLVREVGLRNAAVFQTHILANVGAPLCHPVGLTLIALHATGLLPLPFGRSFATDVLFAASVTGLALGYGVAIWMSRRLLIRRGKRDLARSVWLMPAYWLLASLAAWHALAELVIAPHRWAKTPHDAHDGDAENWDCGDDFR
ncbi:MAG TPA: glycosyltransferase, partial [Methylomirabilota bacterium]|nr:glycosyltransferase [Methylomirabilota bacterium]